MPLVIPVVIGGVVVAAGLFGLKKGAEGVRAIKKAKEIGEGAEQRHRDAVADLDRARQNTKAAFEDLSATRHSIHRTTIHRLIEFLERLDHDVRTRALQHLELQGFPKEEIKTFAVAYLEAGGTIRGALAALATGAGTATATTGAVGALATATTGTAISTLSGAAAHNAVLAWIGGGAASAGGGGMALGSLVLGGVAVGPAVLVAGYVVSAQGEKALSAATQFVAEVDRRVAEIGALITFLSKVDRRIDEIRTVAAGLDQRASLAVHSLAMTDKFDPDSPEHVTRFAFAIQLCRALVELLRIPVLTDLGDINPQVDASLASARALLT